MNNLNDDLETLKEYLQEYLNQGHHKLFIFDDDNNVTGEFKTINALSGIKYLQQRIDKAIEYINEAIEEGDYFESDIDTDITPASYDKYVNSKDLLSILKGENDEN